MQLFLRILIGLAAGPLLMFGLADLLLGMDPFGRGIAAHLSGALAVFTAALALLVVIRPTGPRKFIASTAAAVLILTRAVRFLPVASAFLDGTGDLMLLSIVWIPPLLVMIGSVTVPVRPQTATRSS
jgi:hypothetical protein